ncbi:MAG TPA: nucleotide exchange factor GrpE [Anaerolineales bacterium]|nr:nucleotide exchange factor GrpE [Anaerolineales bacterium]
MTKSGNNKPKPQDSESSGEEIESPPMEAPNEAELTENELTAEELDSVVAPQPIQSDLENIQAQADEYLDGWQRARAEFANYKRRIEREQAEARDRIAGNTLVRFLGVMDDLERALKDRPSDGEAASWSEGIELIYRKLSALVIAEGVEEILAEGTSFDPVLHEALSHEESDDHAEGQVIEVVQRGFRMGDRVLRPALVRVAK